MTGIHTLAVHAGRRPRRVDRSLSDASGPAPLGGGADGDTGALLTPIHQTTTYAQDALGQHKGHTYSRASNPTVAALEERLAALEGGAGAVCFSSGMAAIDAVLRRLRGGEHVLLSDTVYGGTVRLLREVYAAHGVRHSFVDATDPARVADAITPATRLVLVESPANPTLKLADIAAIARVTRERGVTLAVDNTFLTPYGQRALDLGADLAIHSTTKLIEGHNATIGGAVVVRDRAEGGAWLDWLRLVRKSAGTNLAPFEAWLTLRGVKTLGVRCDRQAEQALALARALEAHPAVERVCYPFLASHPQRELARRQQRNGGTVVAFELAGGRRAVERFVAELEVVTLAESLGAVESLVTHPATMTHGAYSPAEREALGVTDGLLRLSVGLEDLADLQADLDRGLRAATRVVA
jgi:cystathionine beta-lyase/cystathionine gamma-synthase